MKKFCWVCDVGSWKIFVVMILAMWEFTSCAWTCRKLFVGYLGHVEVFVHGYGKKFGTCVWTWKILIVVKFLVGHFVVVGHWPYDFSIITDLRLGGERICVNDFLTSIEIKKLLGVVPSRMKSKNIPLSWPCENIPQCDTVAKGAHMFMLLFIGTFLCLDLGSIVNLRYLWSSRKIERIRNYD